MLWLGVAGRVRFYRRCFYGSALPTVCGSTATAFMPRRWPTVCGATATTLYGSALPTVSGATATATECRLDRIPNSETGRVHIALKNQDARCAAGAPYSTRAVVVAEGPALPEPPPPTT